MLSGISSQNILIPDLDKKKKKERKYIRFGKMDK